MPTLITTPDISAETWLGAEACAAGSQECSGMAPALMPKATSASTKIAVRSATGASAPMAPKAKSP